VEDHIYGGRATNGANFPVTKYSLLKFLIISMPAISANWTVSSITPIWRGSMVRVRAWFLIEVKVTGVR
jgi:hypothetical protein